MSSNRIVAALVGASLFVTATAALADPARAGDVAMPLRYVERPLTLPKDTLAPQLSIGELHFQQSFGRTSIAANAIGLDLGVAYGLTDDLTLDLTPLTMLIVRTDSGSFNDTTTYYGTFRLGGTYRFFHSEMADVGGRFEFGATGASHALHLSGGVPVQLRFGQLVRVDTGAFLTAFFPTKGGSVDAAVAYPGLSLPLPGTVGGLAGVPVNASVQVVDAVYAGVDTGFGIASFRGQVDRNCFMPLGFHAGYTLGGAAPVADVALGFSFPFFLLGADSGPPMTRYWQVGLGVRAYLPI